MARIVLPPSNRPTHLRNQQPTPRHAESRPKWYSRAYLSKIFAKRPAQLLAMVAFLTVAAILIYTFAAGQESFTFDFSTGTKVNTVANSNGSVQLATAATGITQIGNLPTAEGSGAIESRQYPGVYWAQPDGGSSTTAGGITYPRPAIYAFKVVNGQIVDIIPGQQYIFFQLDGASDQQWEDITDDENGNIWVGQIGTQSGINHYVLKIKEPDPYNATGIVNHLAASQYTQYNYAFPSGDTLKNAETLLWDTASDQLYLICKNTTSQIYRFATLNTSGTNLLKFIGDLPSGGGNTLSGGDISWDRTRFIAGGPRNDWIYQTNPALSGDAFFLDLIKRGPTWTIDHSTTTGITEGMAFVNDGSYDVVMVSDPAHPIYYLPASFYEQFPIN
jgi:hypothetical protein